MKNEIHYYKHRAKEYELVYEKEERQADLKRIKAYLGDKLIGNTVIEIGCGTGYWTTIIAQNAKDILATDINKEMIDIANNKNYAKRNVSFEIRDYFKLNYKQKYDALFAGFVISHIRKEDFVKFFKVVLDQVKDKGQLVFLDNKFVSGSNTPISRTDKLGNTYQERVLKNGSTYEILKNFKFDKELKIIKALFDVNINVIEFKYYWVLEIVKS